MKNNIKINYIVLSVAILILNALPIIIFWDNVEITKYSIPSIAYAFCSIVWAFIAISFRDHFNLFFLNLYIIAKIFNKSYNESEEYRDDFIKFAFIYCAAIPTFITLSLFVDDFYAGITRLLLVSIIRDVVIIIFGLVPPFVKQIKAKNQQRIKDEADRKEQERRESMGEWK